MTIYGIMGNKKLINPSSIKKKYTLQDWGDCWRRFNLNENNRNGQKVSGKSWPYCEREEYAAYEGKMVTPQQLLIF